jgi:hypothetical protein
MSTQSAIIKSYSSDAKAWYPTPSANLTGTLTSTGKTIKGTDTLFRSELSPGDYLLNATADELQKVARIESDTLLYLDAALTTPISGATCKRIKNDNMKAMQIVFTTANGTIRGASQASGGAWPFGQVWRMKKDGGIDPQLVTPSGGGIACVTLEF